MSSAGANAAASSEPSKLDAVESSSTMFSARKSPAIVVIPVLWNTAKPTARFRGKQTAETSLNTGHRPARTGRRLPKLASETLKMCSMSVGELVTSNPAS